MPCMSQSAPPNSLRGLGVFKWFRSQVAIANLWWLVVVVIILKIAIDGLCCCFALLMQRKFMNAALQSPLLRSHWRASSSLKSFVFIANRAGVATSRLHLFAFFFFFLYISKPSQQLINQLSLLSCLLYFQFCIFFHFLLRNYSSDKIWKNRNVTNWRQKWKISSVALLSALSLVNFPIIFISIQLKAVIWQQQ